MTKLTKHNSYRSLKLASKSTVKSETRTNVRLPELEDFLNLLQQKLTENRKIKNDKL